MQKMLAPYYSKYKQYILPIVLICVSFFIIFKVFLPELTSISEEKRTIETQKMEIETLKKTFQVLSSQDDTKIEDDLKIVKLALPTSKDPSAVFQAMVSAAEKSKVELKQYSFKVGNIYGKQVNSPNSDKKGIPFLTVLIRLSSPDAQSFIRFASEIQKGMPISEVNNINIQGSSGTLEVNFYYKPYDLTVLAKQNKVIPLSASEEKILEQLKEWEGSK